MDVRLSVLHVSCCVIWQHAVWIWSFRLSPVSPAHETSHPADQTAAGAGAVQKVCQSAVGKAAGSWGRDCGTERQGSVRHGAAEGQMSCGRVHVVRRGMGAVFQQCISTHRQHCIRPSALQLITDCISSTPHRETIVSFPIEMLTIGSIVVRAIVVFCRHLRSGKVLMQPVCATIQMYIGHPQSMQAHGYSRWVGPAPHAWFMVLSACVTCVLHGAADYYSAL